MKFTQAQEVAIEKCRQNLAEKMHPDQSLIYLRYQERRIDTKLEQIDKLPTAIGKNLALIDEYFRRIDDGWKLLVGCLEENHQRFLVDELYLAEKRALETKVRQLESQLAQEMDREKELGELRAVIEQQKRELKEKTDENEELVRRLITMEEERNFERSMANVQPVSPATMNARTPGSQVGERTATSAVVKKTKLIVAGGRDTKGHYLKTVDVFDFDVKRWNQAAFKLPDPPRMDCAAATLDDQIYFFSGWDGKKSLSTVDVFDVSRREWMPTTFQTPTARKQSVACSFENRRILIFGGFDGSSYLRSVVSFDPLSTMTWTPLAEMKTGRSHFGVAFLGGKFYVVGGVGEGHVALDSVEKYNPKTDQWSEVASMKTRRKGPAVVVVGNAIFAVGGRDDENACLKSGEVFSLAASSSSSSDAVWTPIAEMPTPRAFASAVVFGGVVYVAGGMKSRKAADVLDSMDIYDTSSNSWTTSSTTMTTARWSAAFALI